MTRKNFGAKPWSFPQPVFIIGTYDENGKPNAMNAAWGGISNDTEISVCISANHKTTSNIQKSKAFTISMATQSQMVACDYVGIASGNDVEDKISRTGWTSVKSEFVNAPIFEQLPLAIECKLISYDEESCRLVGEIINVSASEDVLNEKGKVDPNKLKPICFDPFNLAYNVLGEKVGDAFKSGSALK